MSERSISERDGAEPPPSLYEVLRRLAARHLARERAGHSFQPTDLANEAYLRLASQDKQVADSRSRFLCIAATMIRRILVDHARKRDARKRGRGYARLLLEDLALPGDERDLPGILDVDSALRELALLNERQAKVVELRFFGGLTIDETAEELGVGRDTVKGDWRVARAWLRQRLSAS